MNSCLDANGTDNTIIEIKQLTKFDENRHYVYSVCSDTRSPRKSHFFCTEIHDVDFEIRVKLHCCGSVTFRTQKN